MDLEKHGDIDGECEVGSRRALYRLLFGVGISLIVLAFGLSMLEGIRNERENAKVDAAGLVRKIREGENWIYDVNSFLIRVKSKWTKTPEGIAERLAELKKDNPNSKPDPNLYWGLKSSYSGNLEFAVRQRVVENRRLRRLRDTPGRFRFLDIFNGKDHISHNKYFNRPSESYSITNPKEMSFEMFQDMSWPRAQYHTFWSLTVSKEEMLDQIGRAKEFVCVGREDYRGVDCYVLECEPRALTGGRVSRWYVGVKDGLLYGNMRVSGSRREVEHWTLDYKEVAPGCWYPMRQGYEFYRKKWLKTYLDSRRDLEVVEVRVNEELPDSLFEMEFKEGVNVNDERTYDSENGQGEDN